MTNVLVTLIVMGLVLWAIDEFIPLDPRIKKLIQVVVVVGACIFVLQSFGLIGHRFAIGR